MFNIVFGIFLGFFLTASVASGYNPFSFKKDITDGEKRSGLIIYTDYGTGVQYVANIMGGMSVRVDKDGSPMIAEAEEQNDQ